MNDLTKFTNQMAKPETFDQIQIGSRGNVNINAPYAILQTVGIMSVFAVFIVVAMVAGTVLRDDEPEVREVAAARLNGLESHEAEAPHG